GWEAPVTVAELVNAGPLAGARMYGSGENPVHQVRIVDELSVFGAVAPHTAVVLIGSAASGGWAVEMAMRRAWEQAAACVIAPSGGLSAGSGEVLAERLGVTLIFIDDDPLIVAVRVASAASRPDAARTQLVARCATRLADAGTSARRVLGVLNAELPGTSVVFLDRYGIQLAGRRTATRPADEPAAPRSVAAADRRVRGDGTESRIPGAAEEPLTAGSSGMDDHEDPHDRHTPASADQRFGWPAGEAPDRATPAPGAADRHAASEDSGRRAAGEGADRHAAPEDSDRRASTGEGADRHAAPEDTDRRAQAREGAAGSRGTDRRAPEGLDRRAQASEDMDRRAAGESTGGAPAREGTDWRASVGEGAAR
ncbi:hypothetical protein ITP53_55485, partial [Nonomuraea sp. K274]|nr:hypothetical protein [Nonomuraea cypriaca]